MQISSAGRWSALALAPFLVACGDPDRMDVPADAGNTVDAPVPVADAPEGDVGADTTLPERLELGAVSCGTTATMSFELPNRGPAPLMYSFSVGRDVDIEPHEGIVAPGAAQTIVVAARVSSRAAARTAFAATATMTSNARQGHALSIPVTFHAQGAAIVMPSQISFGDTAIQTAASRTFTIRNDGDVAAQVGIPLPSGEISVQLGADGGPITVEPGDSVTGEARYLPTNIGPDSALPGIEITQPTCGEQPILMLLSGQGVPRGGVVVGAGPVDFGDATCGVAAPGQPIQLTNPETNDATFTAEVVTGVATDRVFHVSPSSGTVPAGGAVTLTVTSDAIAGPATAHVYAATLRVTTRLDTSTLHVVPIRMNLPAAKLFIAANAGNRDDPFAAVADLGFVPVGTTAVTSFAVVNTGNKVATLTPSLATPFRIVAPATIRPGEFVDGTIEYTAASAGPVSVLSGFATGDACASPITLELHAGVGPAAIIEPATATTTSPAPATVSAPLRVTNSGNAPLHLTCAEHGTSGALQLAPAELTIPAGGSDAFTVTMVAGPNATGLVHRDIRCGTNEVLHDTRDTTMTLTVVPAE